MSVRSVFSTRAGAVARQQLVVDTILKAGVPLSGKELRERLWSKMSRGFLETAIARAVLNGLIVATPRGGYGHRCNEYRVAERRTGT